MRSRRKAHGLLNGTIASSPRIEFRRDALPERRPPRASRRRGGRRWRPVGAGLQTLPLIWYVAVGVPARRRMAPALGDPGRGRPAGGLPRLSARLRPAHARSPAADAGLSPRRPLRRGAPPLAGVARRAGRRPLLPRALRGARAHPAARSRGCAAGSRRAPGARAGRGLLLPPGPHVPALDLRRAGGARRDAAGRLAARQPPAPRQLPAPARAGGGHQRHRGRGDRHHPGAALARHGHRGRGGGRRHLPRGARRAAHLARAGALLPGADGQGPLPVHHGQVPYHARRRRAEDGPRAGERERSAHHLARALSPRAAPGRAAAAVERALRRHELRRPAPGAARVRARLRARHPGLRRALQGAPGAHRLRAGERRVPHLARDQAQVRPCLHLQPLPLARRPHPGGHGEGDAHPARGLSVAGGPPLAARRAADTLLGVTAAAIPLSTTGMEAGVLGLAALSCAALIGKWGVVRRTPLDGVLALFAGVLALSTLASGHPLEASGWARLWIALAYFVVFWWLRDAAHAVRLARVIVVAGAVAAAYGILQHFTGADWYRTLLGRPTYVYPREPGTPGYAVVGFFRSYLTFAHVMIFPLAWALAGALAGRAAAVGAALLVVLALVFSTARGAWLAAVAVGAAPALVARHRPARLVLPACAAAAGLAFAGTPALRAEAAHMFSAGGANAGRVGIYRANLDIVHARPVLGLGFGRHRKAAPAYYAAYPAADRRSHAHNNFLQMAAEAGLAGLAAFGLVYATLLRRGVETIESARDGETWAADAGAWAGVE